MNDVRFDPENALTSSGGGRAEVDNGPEPADPEPVGPIAEKVLDRLTAQQADDDLAARRREVIARLLRQTPAIRTRKDHHR